MQEKLESGVTEWVDPDDAPELDDAWFDGAILSFNGRPYSPAPPGTTKTEVTLSLDADLVSHFKALGRSDWEALMNSALRSAISA